MKADFFSGGFGGLTRGTEEQKNGFTAQKNTLPPLTRTNLAFRQVFIQGFMQGFFAGWIKKGRKLSHSLPFAIIRPLLRRSVPVLFLVLTFCTV